MYYLAVGIPSSEDHYPPLLAMYSDIEEAVKDKNYLDSLDTAEAETHLVLNSNFEVVG